MLQSCQAHQVVGDHFQPDDDLGTRQTESAQVLAAHLRQPCERVLTEGTLLGDTSVAPLLRFADRAVGRALALDVCAVALHVQVRLAGVLGVAASGVDVLARVGLVQDRFEHLGIAHRGGRHLDTADEAPAPVAVGVQS